MALINYGRGKVLWSAVPIESENFYEYGRIFTRLIKDMLGFEGTVRSDAPKDVEITLFRSGDSLLVNTVLLNTDFKARHVEDFKISITCDKQPKTLRIIPIEKEVPFAFDGRIITFESKNLNIFNMYRMDF